MDPLDTPCVKLARECANAWSLRYFGAPVYLVGGALRDPDPRDLDIVVPLEDELFVACYGDPGDRADGWQEPVDGCSPPSMWMRWARDCAKHSRQLTLYCHRAVDFKVQPRCLFDRYDEAKHPRFRLNTVQLV